MSNSNNNNKDWGLFAIIFAAIFGSLYGLFKIGKTLTDRSESMDQLTENISKMMKSGMTDDQMIQLCYDDASKQFNRRLTNSEKESIEKAFWKAKNRVNQ